MCIREWGALQSGMCEGGEVQCPENPVGGTQVPSGPRGEKYMTSASLVGALKAGTLGCASAGAQPGFLLKSSFLSASVKRRELRLLRLSS